MSHWDRMADTLIRARNAGEVAARIDSTVRGNACLAAQERGFCDGTAACNAFVVAYLRALPRKPAEAGAPGLT